MNESLYGFRALTVTELMQEACKATGKWGVFLALPDLASLDYRLDEVLKSVPFLNLNDHAQAIADGYCVVLCDTEETCENIYCSTVGDDGPTDLNEYDGKARTYALTCDPQGNLRNENT